MKILKFNVEKPLELLSCGHFISDMEWMHGKRCLDSYEVIIGVERILYIQEEDVRYEVRPGDVLVLRPGLVHKGYRTCEAGISFFWLHFTSAVPAAVLEKEIFHHEWMDWNMLHTRIDSRCLYLPQIFSPPAIERISILFQQLQHICNSNYYTQQAMHYIATILLIELSEQLLSNYKTTFADSSDRLIAEMIEWIRINSHQPITVTDVAACFKYNKEYLSLLFRKKTGYNLLHYIHMMKITKSKEMLSASTNSVKEIAAKVGIDDEKYFMRLFRKYERITPTEYRKAFYRLHMNNH